MCSVILSYALGGSLCTRWVTWLLTDTVYSLRHYVLCDNGLWVTMHHVCDTVKLGTVGGSLCTECVTWLLADGTTRRSQSFEALRRLRALN